MLMTCLPRFHLARQMGGVQQVISNGLAGYRVVVAQFIIIFILPLAFGVAFAGSVLTTYYGPFFLIVTFLTCALYIMGLLRGSHVE